MFNKLQSVLASRLASAMLTAALFAALTAPFVLLQSMHVFAAPAPLPCTEGNNNGCTELSATPPEDLQTVPPNVVLMLDDSGSMAWDYMPDWTDLSNNTLSGTRNYSVNGLYYNPAVTYTPPPKADGSSYPNSPGLTGAYRDGFATPTSTVNITTFTGGSTGQTFRYWENLPTTVVNVTSNPAPVYGCPSGYTLSSDGTICNINKANKPLPPVNPTLSWVCNSGDPAPNTVLSPPTCTHTDKTGENPVITTYDATQVATCPSGFTLKKSDGLCYQNTLPPTTVSPYWYCPSGGTMSADHTTCTSSTRVYVYVFTYYAPNPSNPTSFIQYFVAPGTGCDNLYYPAQQAVCANEGNAAGTASPAGVAVGQNVANWFSYYRTRIEMAKSGLMTAFTNLDPKYRVGFASINATAKSSIPTTPTPYTFDDATSGGGNSSNPLAVVQPFGDGSSGTQKANFWNWLAKAAPSGNTPLRKALQGAGEYYKTAQPWTAMSGDPGYTTGSTTKFACRASYTILTTDGFWNGSDPSGIGSAAATDGPVQTVPAGNVVQYTATAPYSGGGASGGLPSLADVATYYWENDLSDMANEVAPSTADPASWQHMTTFTVGLGYQPVGITPATATMSQIFAWARGGAPITGFGWPTPASNSLYNIADLAHAAVNGHGDFFNANNPQQLAAAFAKAIKDIGARTVAPTTAAVNSSVLSVGAVAFRTGYSTGDWTGQFQAVTLNTDGNVDSILWKADALLDAAYHSPTTYTTRKVYTNAYDLAGGTYSSFQLTAANQTLLDSVESAGLQAPALAGGGDTLGNRINYLLGDNTYEGTTFRARTSILGAILHAEPVYVAGASGKYRDDWPTFGTYTPPEAVTGAQTFAVFASAQATRASMVYVGANDGMLHAFNAPVPQCTGTIDSSGNCSAYTFPTVTNQGQEAWAFVPRAVYVNLGNLTTAANFAFRPTVDATPVARDVFFSSDKKWHTLLAGSVGVGGRGVYGLDITNPTTFAASDVLWEFDADMAAASTCVANYGTCKGTDLGFTVAQPNVARLSNGEWVVLVPNGYFPDCGTPDYPTADQASCDAIAAQAPKDASGNPYSALFVLDAQTGKMIAELKTPTNLGVTSFGLSKPVLGDYNSDQVDDVAFAGDVQGNLWRFDLSSTSPADWAVTLVYKGVFKDGHQGVQPITTMPRLFADPTTNRFMVLFGTGKYLGVGDNSNSVVQSIIAVRDVPGTAYSQADMTQQYLHETVAPATLPDGSANPNAGVTLRCITGSSSSDCTTTTAINSVPSSAGGWYVNLYTTASDGTLNDAGERIVVNPAAIFSTNTVIFQSLITGSQSTDACNPSTQGAILALNASTGGSAGVPSLGGPPIAGGRISNARTSGSLPIISAVGGATAYIPGSNLGGKPFSPPVPNWRRRSWRVLLNEQ